MSKLTKNVSGNANSNGSSSGSETLQKWSRPQIIPMFVGPPIESGVGNPAQIEKQNYNTYYTDGKGGYCTPSTNMSLKIIATMGQVMTAVGTIPVNVLACS